MGEKRKVRKRERNDRIMHHASWANYIYPPAINRCEERFINIQPCMHARQEHIYMHQTGAAQERVDINKITDNNDSVGGGGSTTIKMGAKNIIGGCPSREVEERYKLDYGTDLMMGVTSKILRKGKREWRSDQGVGAGQDSKKGRRGKERYMCDISMRISI
jgi:hypothetical protein